MNLDKRYSMATHAALTRVGIDPRAVEARGLTEYREPETLKHVAIEEGGREHYLEPVAATAWLKLTESAASDGVTLFIVSAFRSIDRQVAIFERKLAAGQMLEQLLRVSAPPGFSEHHTGRAIDVGAPACASLQAEFEATEAFEWLTNNAGRFGFAMSYPPGNIQGYDYEPWHWCYQTKQDSVCLRN